MPKFSEAEKEMIQNKLLIEGEKLFVAHGLKKVTIDDLVEAVGIAKGSFYAFFKSKEHLYVEIHDCRQKVLSSVVEEMLDKSNELPSREFAERVLVRITDSFLQYPILLQMDDEMQSYLERKLSPELLDGYTYEGILALQRLMEDFIRFLCPPAVAGKVMETILSAAVLLQNDQYGSEVLKILIKGVVDQIVMEE